MSLKVIWTSKFKKDYKMVLKRGLNIDLLDNVIRILAKGDKLPERYSWFPAVARNCTRPLPG